MAPLPIEAYRSPSKHTFQTLPSPPIRPKTHPNPLLTYPNIFADPCFWSKLLFKPTFPIEMVPLPIEAYRSPSKRTLPNPSKPTYLVKNPSKPFTCLPNTFADPSFWSKLSFNHTFPFEMAASDLSKPIEARLPNPSKPTYLAENSPKPITYLSKYLCRPMFLVETSV